MDTKEVIRQAMAILGSAKSERKTKACRLNAQRPRKRKKRTVSKAHAKKPSEEQIAINAQ